MNDTHSLSLTQAWLESLRPKTLPLAFAAIVVGTVLAWWQGYFDRFAQPGGHPQPVQGKDPDPVGLLLGHAAYHPWST